MMLKAIILVIFTIVGFIHGVYIFPSFNILISWILIGLWIVFSLNFLKKVKQHKEYNSPHNTAYFTILPIFVGIFFAIWSNYTGLLGINLLNYPNVLLTPWSIIFALPYLIYGIFSIYKMFKDYISVYFGIKSIKSRLFGFFIAIFSCFSIFIYWITFFSHIIYFDTLLNPININFDILLISMVIIIGGLIIYPGILGKDTFMTQISPEYIERRTRSLNEIIGSEISSVQTTPSLNISQEPISPRRRQIENVQTSSNQLSPTTQNKTQKKTTNGVKTSQSKSQIKFTSQKQYRKYKPLGGNLTKDDFKCIFCFELPNPTDRRGLIICPICKYPAHEDEFKDWTKSSGLCSRCEGSLPPSYMRNPKTISTNDYTKIWKYFLEEK